VVDAGLCCIPTNSLVEAGMRETLTGAPRTNWLVQRVCEKFETELPSRED
jgi:hypothetical protein